MTLDHVYVAAVVIITTAAALQVVVRPHDFWWHLANGRTIVEAGSFPTIDSFTYTRAGESFFNQMWLAQVIMYGLHRLGGVALVVTVHGAVIGLAYAILLRVCILLTGRMRLCALVFLAAIVPLSFTNWAVRPQPYAFPLFVAFVALLVYDYRSATKTNVWTLWLLPLLMVLWVNIHGSYVLGLVVVTVVAVAHVVVGRMRRLGRDTGRIVAVAAATWAAVLLNPRGFSVLSYAAKLMTNTSVAEASEWRATAPEDFMGVLYYVVAASMILLMVYGPRPRPVEVIMVILFMLLGFTAVRHTIWFALAAAPLLCLQASSLTRSTTVHRDPGVPVLNGMLLAFLGSALLLSLPSIRSGMELPIGGQLISATPVEATRYLAGLPERPERIFNDLGYGSYLAWALPQQKTFIDPRFELFPLDQVQDYRSLSSGRDVEALAEKYRFDGFLVSRAFQPDLVEQLRASQDWRVDFQDEEAVLFLPAP